MHMSSDGLGSAQKHGFLTVGTRQHLRWLDGIVKAIIVLNVLDAIFTVFWVQAGIAEEANAFLRILVDNHAVVFVSAKISLVSLGSLLLWRHRKHRLAVVGLFAVFLAYYFILLYHLKSSNLLVRYLVDV